MNRSFQWSQAFWLLSIGIGIGWLAGLSVSAVVGGIITSLLGIGAGVVTGLQAVRFGKGDNQNGSNIQHIDARPAAMLVLGIALSAPCGIIARTYHVFEPRQPQAAYDKDQSQSATVRQSSNSEKPKADQGVLFGAQQKECDQLLSLARMGHDKTFAEQLDQSSIPCAKEMTSRFQDDPATLAVLVETICKCSAPK